MLTLMRARHAQRIIAIPQHNVAERNGRHRPENGMLFTSIFPGQPPEASHTPLCILARPPLASTNKTRVTPTRLAGNAQPYRRKVRIQRMPASWRRLKLSESPIHVGTMKAVVVFQVAESRQIRIAIEHFAHRFHFLGGRPNLI